jgi:predicted ATP-grasp superfamily ATP-dependent carboligase
MRILFAEHFCSGGLGGLPLDRGLLAQGKGMLQGLVADFEAAGHEAVTLCDARLQLDVPGTKIPVVADGFARALDTFSTALGEVDAAVVVAPESDALLAAWTERVERAGVVNLGSSGAGVRLAADKAGLCRLLRGQGVRVPADTPGLDGAEKMLRRHGALVVKPNQGAGCVDTFVIRDAAALAGLPDRSDWLVQEHVPGMACSVAFVVSADGRPRALRAGFQSIGPIPGGPPDAIGYHGGRLPLPVDLEPRAIAIGLAALTRIPGLRGLVGVDVVLGDDAAGDTVIEVNPRPTVAYAALRRLARFLIPHLFCDRAAQLAWHEGTIHYDADGTCREAE